MARPLHGQKPPPVALQKESPAHRVVVLLVARGMRMKEVFEHLGGKWENGKPVSGTGMFSYQHLLTISKQPWFKKEVVDILEESGMDKVKAMLEAETIPSIERLIDLRDNAESESVRLSATNSLIDRIRGKATQHVESTTTHKYEKTPSEAEKLDKEIAKIEAKLNSGTN